ncbi:uncharacterized protein LOC128232056 isoform X2 [Mya arenaria]|nr:uncharacterized protein LOC128232056 isoform X2 [Mya arenaria]
MRALLMVAAVPLVALSVTSRDVDWKQKVEYFARVFLNCSETGSKNVTLAVYFWILPSGDVVYPGSKDMPKQNVELMDNGFVLQVDKVDDIDFGLYYCIIQTGPNSTGIVKRGLNVDGPYFGPAYMDNIGHSAMVGGIAAGCTLVLLTAVWLICAHCKVVPRRNVLAVSQNSDKVSSKDPILSDKSDDDIYYIADGIKTTPVKRNVTYESVSGIASTSESGHYLSIGSLERNIQDPYGDSNFMDPGVNHNNYVNDVHQDEEQASKESDLYSTVVKNLDGSRAGTKHKNVINGDVVLEATGNTMLVTSSLVTDPPRLADPAANDEGALDDVFEPDLTEDSMSMTPF